VADVQLERSAFLLDELGEDLVDLLEAGAGVPAGPDLPAGSAGAAAEHLTRARTALASARYASASGSAAPGRPRRSDRRFSIAPSLVPKAAIASRS
jgi:hypothetical protein